MRPRPACSSPSLVTIVAPRFPLAPRTRGRPPARLAGPTAHGSASRCRPRPMRHRRWWWALDASARDARRGSAIARTRDRGPGARSRRPSSAFRRRVAPSARSAADRSGDASPACPRPIAPSTWAADQLRKAGIADVRVQAMRQEPRAGLWLPLSWEVKLLGDAGFGAGSADVVLHSAIPVVPSEITGGTLTAPLVYIGSGGPAVLERDRRRRQDRGAADRAAGAHAVRARRRDLAGAGTVQARGGGRAHAAPPARQRAGTRLLELRRPVLQHRRPRWLVRGVGAERSRAPQDRRTGARAADAQVRDPSQPRRSQRRGRHSGTTGRRDAC